MQDLRLYCSNPQVLLEPLSKVLGSTKSKALLLRLADSGPALTRLQLLGWLLGHADWTDSFTELCNPPADGVTASVDNSFDGVIEVCVRCSAMLFSIAKCFPAYMYFIC